MTLFDKICAVPTIIVGAIFLVLGVFGLFFGCNAHFTLPPVLGGLPFFLGWGMCVVLVKYWILSNQLREAQQRQTPPQYDAPRDPVNQTEGSDLRQ